MIVTGSRKKALEAEESALLEILEKAQTIDEIIRVQDRISNVRAELESYVQRLQRLNNQVNYSTVYMSVSEVERIVTPTLSFKALAGSGFMRSLKNVGSGLRGFFIWLISSLPYFALAAIIGIPALLLLKRHTRKRNSRYKNS